MTLSICSFASYFVRVLSSPRTFFVESHKTADEAEFQVQHQMCHICDRLLPVQLACWALCHPVDACVL